MKGLLLTLYIHQNPEKRSTVPLFSPSLRLSFATSYFLLSTCNPHGD